jgi:DNA-binding winged helix-turn-helix (wHTH) protein
VALVKNAGRVVEKDELIAYVWTNVIVDECNLRVHIAALRRLLGDDQWGNRYIVHVARRGYIFVAPLVLTDRPISLLAAVSL